jgi:hypothetical protein
LEEAAHGFDLQLQKSSTADHSAPAEILDPLISGVQCTPLKGMEKAFLFAMQLFGPYFIVSSAQGEIHVEET